MKIINLARSRKINLENQYNLQEHLQDISFKDLEYLNRCLVKYKKENQMYEFIDMISLFIEKEKCPSLDAVFLDEAQDLNNLQWDMFHYIESKAKRCTQFIKGLRKEILQLSHACGYEHPCQFTGKDIEMSAGVNLFRSLDDVMNYKKIPVPFSSMDNLRNQ